MNDELGTLEIANSLGVEITESETDISASKDFTELQIDSFSKAALASFVAQLPSLAAASTLRKGYCLRFPNGIPEPLMRMKRGGMSTSLVDKNGRITGTASLYEMKGQAALIGAVSAMGVVSGQYFLSEINNNLKIMRMEVDKILEFLYGDKKAELMSEISFVKYALKNYMPIMSIEQHKIATLVSLQESRKVAMKDIEFYMRDLDSTITSKQSQDLNELISKAIQIRDSLELSVQLSVASNVLEVYYSGNFDPVYLQYVEKELFGYIEKLDKQILGSFSAIGQMIQTEERKNKILQKSIEPAKKNEILETVEMLKNSGEETSIIRKQLHSALTAPAMERIYFVEPSGKAFIKSV